MTKAVDVRWTTHRTYPDVRTWVQQSLLTTLRKAGYRVGSDVETETVAGPHFVWQLKRTNRSPFLLPISILAFLVNTSTDKATLTLSTPGPHTELHIDGRLPGGVAKLMHQLADSSVA